MSEAYVTVVLWTNPAGDGSQQEIVARSRSLDRWSPRDGRWAIDDRVHVQDMHTVHALVRGDTNAESRRDTQAPSFGLFAPSAPV